MRASSRQTLLVYLAGALAFLSVDASGATSTWSYRRQITIDSTKVMGASDHVDFPVLISLTDPTLRTTANGGGVESTNGHDIVFTAADGVTRLDFEIETYDGANGTLVAWVRIPTLQVSINTDLFLYYGNSAIDYAQGSSCAVWSNGYVGVWHLDEQGTGRYAEYRDSSAQGNHGIGGNGSALHLPARATGQIGFGQYFDRVYADGDATISQSTTTVTFANCGNCLPTNIQAGDTLVLDPGGANEETFTVASRDSATQVTVVSPAAADHTAEAYVLYDEDPNNDMINVGDDPSLDVTGDQITLEAWIQHDITPDFGVTYGFLNHKGFDNGYRVVINQNSHKIRFSAPGSTDSVLTSGTVSANTWHHVVATYDGATMKVYIDGVKDANETAKTGNIPTVPPTQNDVWIGHGDQPVDKAWSYPWEGFIDEVRISTVARDADWIATEFNNQSSPSTFYAVGAEQPGAYSLDTFDVNYRSIGTGGQIYATGQASVALGSKVVSFTGSLPSNLGIGDKLVLDPLGANEETLFILSRDSASQVTLQTPATKDHGAGENFSIERAYGTLQAWENDRGGDLVGELRREVGVTYKDGDLTGTLTVSGSTTDCARFLWLTAAPVARHAGVAGTGVVLRPAISGDAIAVADDYTRIEWLEITGWPGASDDAVRINADHTSHRYMIVHDGGDGDSDGFRLLQNSGDWTATVENSIAYNLGRGCYQVENWQGTATLTLKLRNVTAFNCGWGGSANGGGVSACENTLNETYLYARNVLSVGNSNADFNTASTANCDDIPSWGISNGNVSTDLTAPGSDIITGAVAANQFTSTTGGSEDLHLKAGADALDSAEISLHILDDIDSRSRLDVALWDVGADELEATTAVELASFSAEGLESEVVLRWRTASELDNLGFHVHRATSAEGPYERLTERPIPGLGSSPVGAEYVYRDRDVADAVTYFYVLEDLETTGASSRHGPVSAAPSPPEEAFELAPEEPEASLVYGLPSANALTIEPSRNHADVELVTAGFTALIDDDGSVQIDTSDFETSPAGLPIRRTWIEAVAGREVEIVSVHALDVTRFSGLVAGPVAALEPEADPAGAVRLRRRARMDRKNPPSTEWARLASVGYQGDVKKALVELMPFRRDPRTGELLLASRLVVRLSFAKPEGTRRPVRRRAERTLLAHLATHEPGLYGVAYEALFPRARRRAIPASSLRLSRQGSPVAYRLEPPAEDFGPGSTLYFVSPGGSANPYGDEAVYELELGQPGLLMKDAGASFSQRTLAHFWHRLEREENRLYQAGLVDAPDIWLWDLLFAPARKTYPFAVAELAETTEPSRVRVWLQGTSDLPARPDHHVRVFLNEHFLGELFGEGKRSLFLDAEIPPGVLHEGENLLAVENVGDTGASYSMVMLNRFEVVYPRLPLAVSGIVEGVFSADGIAELSGFDRGALAIDVTDDAARSVAVSTRGGDRIALSVTAGHRYLVVAPGGVLRPEVRATRASGLESARHRADYLAIGPRSFLSALSPLLERRRAQGLTPMAVSVEDIYLEFGHGEASPEAIRRFLDHAYHHWRSPRLRYVLLVGDATYDFEDHLGTGVRNRVPPLMIPTRYLWTASDAMYGAIHGDDPLPDVAVGRLPAADVGDVETMVAKILAYERAGHPFVSSAVLVADDPDEAGDFPRHAEELMLMLRGSVPVQTISLERLGPAATRREVAAAFDRGASLVSYLGHGGIHLWAEENIFETKDLDRLGPQSEQPIVLTMNCLNGYFHFPYFDSLAEALVKAEGKGAIAAFSPSGMSLNAPAHRFHRLLLRELVGGGHLRLGDAILAAQDAYAATGAFPKLLSIFNLLGDPALSLR